MDHKDYHEIPSFNRLENKDLDKKSNISKSDVDLKASETSQQIFDEIKLQPNDQKKLHSQSTEKIKDSKNPSQQKTDSFVNKFLITHEENEPNKPKLETQDKNMSKFQFMTEDELEIAIGEAKTEDEINAINERFLELKKNAEESSNTTHENPNQAENIKGLQNFDNKSVIINQFKNTRLLNKEWDSNFIPDNSDIKRLTLNKFILINHDTGEISVSEKTAKKYRIGQIIKSHDEYGKPIDVTIKKIRIINKEEFEFLKDQLIKHYDVIYPSRHEEEKTKEKFSKTSEIPIKHQKTALKHPKTAKNLDNPQLNRSSKEVLQQVENSKKEINEQRLERFEKMVAVEEAKIKKSVEKHELLAENMQYHNLHFDIDKSNIQERDVLTDKNLKEISMANTKIDIEFRQIIKQIQESKKNHQISLPLLARFKRLEIVFEKLTKLVPKGKGSYETLAEIVPLKKEITSFVKEFLSSSGGEFTAKVWQA